MPTSNHMQISKIVDLIRVVKPQKLLDIGVGFGKYGFLAREYLELWDGREKYDDWKIQIDGIEAFEKYLTPVHKYIYNRVYVGDALEVLTNVGDKYDLILMIDVFEHFDYVSGMKLLNLCLNHSRNVLIAVPSKFGVQGESFGNSYEKHRFQWTKKHFNEFAEKFFITEVKGAFIVFVGQDSKEVVKCYKNREPIIRHLPKFIGRALGLKYLRNIIRDIVKTKKTD